MNRHHILVAAAVGLWAALSTYACGDGATQPLPTVPEPPRPTTVAVAPATVRLPALGATEQLTAEVRDQNGNVMAGAAVSWASSAASVATVSASGLVTAVGNGEATITASAGEGEGSAVVRVAQSAASVEVSPSAAEVIAFGATVQLIAEAFDANGHSVAGEEFSWESDDPSVAAVDISGLVTAVGNGEATITASAGEGEGSAVVRVAQSAASVEVSPSAAEVIAFGATVQLIAEAFDANGHSVAGEEFSWESSDPSVATVDASGLVTAAAGGEATITASVGEAKGSAAIRVVELTGLEAYVTQAVQSREHPVPLVAGEKALLRVFVTAAHPTTADIPPVRARFYLNGTERHVADIPATATAIPTEVVEGDLSSSANVEIPAEIIQPGLEMVINIDPDRIPDAVARRIPETGRIAIDVHEMPLFDLTLIPFIWSETQDRSIVDLVTTMAADPENHEMLRNVVTLLPVGDLVVSAHEPVLSTTNHSGMLHSQTKAIRAMEGSSGHYLGMMSRPTTGAHGLANRAARTVFSLPHPFVIGHELGHTMSLNHAACGSAIGGLDPSFPYSGGSIGVWGYDFRDGGKLVPPDYTDLMGYCNQRYWISDYHFTKALRFRLANERAPGAAATVAPVPSLLLWGGVDADGLPRLEPAFVVDAPPSLPRNGGEYEIKGRAANGREWFSLQFDMPATADGDGSSSFAFVLPVQPGWEGNLASISLFAPEGSFTLDAESDQPMAILRNPRNGQVRGILRDLPPPTQAAADAVGQSAGTGLEVLFSRGIPGAEAWRW